MNALQSIVRCLCASGMIVSCSSSGGGGGVADSASTSLAPLSQRLNQEQGYVQDSEGNWTTRSDKRSQFENRVAAGGDRRNSFANRRFAATEYQTAEWTRAQSTAPQSFTGNTDGSRFLTAAADQGKVARQSGKHASISGQYQTQDFATSTSRENSARRHDRPSNAQIENRRDSLPPPEIIDWRQQRDLSIEKSRSILSR